jgi:hypothetical protein
MVSSDMSATLARAVGRKRLLAMLVLVLATLGVVVSVASAGGIRDEPCPTVAGEGTNTCPAGTVGEAYSVRFRAVEEPPCAPGDDTWHISSGSAPPGLSMATDGTLSGTPTQAGTFTFYVEMKLPDYWIPEEGRGCNGTADTSQKQFTIPINPALPRLVIGPESAGPGTVSTQYSLQMTASLSDPKTWSVVDGALPPGLVLDPTSGLISGVPTTPGTYVFTVRAALADQRSDTKTLGIVVRPQLAIARGSVPASEVGVRLLLPLTASGGTEQFTWSLSAGELPTGVALEPTGTIAGVPTSPGRFPFTVSVTDTEGRVATLAGRLVVADRLSIVVKRLRATKVGRFYRLQLRSIGGVKPTTWRIKRGPLPRGVRFDRELGMFIGTPKRARTYRIGVEARDVLRVKATATIVVVVKPAKKPKSKQ